MNLAPGFDTKRVGNLVSINGIELTTQQAGWLVGDITHVQHEIITDEDRDRLQQKILGTDLSQCDKDSLIHFANCIKTGHPARTSEEYSHIDATMDVLPKSLEETECDLIDPEIFEARLQWAIYKENWTAISKFIKAYHARNLHKLSS